MNDKYKGAYILMENVQCIGHVIRILDEFTLLIDAGKSCISVNDEIEIYELGEPIKAIDGSILSEYVYVKDKLTVVETQEKYSICKKNKLKSAISFGNFSALSPLLEEYNSKRIPLNVDPEDFQPFAPQNPKIQIGDLVKRA